MTGDKIHIEVTWKKLGGPEEFRRPEWVARWLREHLAGVMLFRVDLDPIFQRERKSKPPGWDDYIIAVKSEVKIQ